MEELQIEFNRLKASKVTSEQNCLELCAQLSNKDKEVENMQQQLMELKRDIQDATMIVAQKTKTNDEIGKDLIEANRLIVNFTSQNDILMQETEQLKERLSCKENIIKSQVIDIEKINREFQNYCAIYNADETSNLQHELFLARQKVEELEKQNKDVVKLNSLLTKKLSSSDVFQNRSQSSVPPK